MNNEKCDWCDEKAVETYEDQLYCQKHLDQAEAQADMAWEAQREDFDPKSI
jgi:hypothetical protein